MHSVYSSLILFSRFVRLKSLHNTVIRKFIKFRIGFVSEEKKLIDSINLTRFNCKSVGITFTLVTIEPGVLDR